MMGNYLEQVTDMHEGNVGGFSIGDITEQDVARRLRGVKAKPSYGEDEVSYKDLKILSRWVINPMTKVFQRSIKQGEFPSRWKSSRIKPLWKGEGNKKEEAKSYRPVALLSAIGRLLEGIVAERMDRYSEERGLVHRQIHGFRRRRGVSTGMLSLWEEVMKEGGEGNKIVAMAFIDVSAGFDSVPHTQLLRKLEGIGYGTGALKWISDYLTGRSQYVVVEAEDGRRFGMPVGTPQGGALGPILWREYTNDLPECVRGKSPGNGREEHEKEKRGWGHQKQDWSLSDWVDSKPDQGMEETHDAKMREEGVLPSRRGGGEQRHQGPDRLRYRAGGRGGGGNCILYADDTSATVKGELWPELEVKLSRMLGPLFNQMKINRLKVNEDKTGLILIGSMAARRRLLEGGGRRTLMLAGEMIKPTNKAKSLGLIISEDMNWTDEVDSRVTKCSHKLRSLMRLRGVATMEQRKTLAEGVILSRLNQHLEVVSMGRRADLAKLQRMQNRTMRWVTGEGMRAFRTERSLKNLNWLDVGQAAAKATILAAMKVAHGGTQEDLEGRLGKRDKTGKLRIKNVSKAELQGMNMWVRKAWSTRARRWMKMMPEDIRSRDPWLASTKKLVREWVKENVARKGEDAVPWGKWEERELEVRRSMPKASMDGKTDEEKGGAAKEEDQEGRERHRG